MKKVHARAKPVTRRYKFVATWGKVSSFFISLTQRSRTKNMTLFFFRDRDKDGRQGLHDLRRVVFSGQQQGDGRPFRSDEAT